MRKFILLIFVGLTTFFLPEPTAAFPSLLPNGFEPSLEPGTISSLEERQTANLVTVTIENLNKDFSIVYVVKSINTVSNEVLGVQFTGKSFGIEAFTPLASTQKSSLPYQNRSFRRDKFGHLLRLYSIDLAKAFL